MPENVPITTRNLIQEIPARRPRTAREWQPTIPASLLVRAIAAAHLVAERLHDPDYVVDIAKLAEQQSTLPLRWNPASVGFGFGSVALAGVFFARCFPEEGWEAVTHRYLQLAAAETRRQPLAFPNFLDGTGGLATILAFLSERDTRYQQMASTLNEQICQQVYTMPWRFASDTGTAAQYYDVISGASGVLAHLVTIDTPNTHVLAAVEALLEYLILLTGIDEASGYERWFIPPELLPNVPGSTHRQAYPRGYFDCGLAHGIPGPLAALGSAWLHGYRLPGLREAIISLSDWIVQHQVQDTWGINWPAGIPLQAAGSSCDWSMLPAARAAWCYGAPGITRALWLAGSALDDKSLRQIAVEGIEAVLRRPIDIRHTDSPTLCHGTSGLLQICLRFAHETDSSLVHEHIPLLVGQLLDVFDPDLPLGFREIEPGNVGVDHPGWLNGVSGTVLSLLAATTTVTPDWDHALLIS